MIGWLRRLFTPPPDPAWKPTGVRQVFAGYDERPLHDRFEAEERLAAARREQVRLKIVIPPKP